MRGIQNGLLVGLLAERGQNRFQAGSGQGCKGPVRGQFVIIRIKVQPIGVFDDVENDRCRDANESIDENPGRELGDEQSEMSAFGEDFGGVGKRIRGTRTFAAEISVSRASTVPPTPCTMKVSKESSDLMADLIWMAMKQAAGVILTRPASPTSPAKAPAAASTALGLPPLNHPIRHQVSMPAAAGVELVTKHRPAPAGASVQRLVGRHGDLHLIADEPPSPLRPAT